jgi:MFS family permease
VIGLVLLVSGVAGPILGGIAADLCQRSGGPRRTMLMLSVVALITAPLGCFDLMPDTAIATTVLLCFAILSGMLGVAQMTLVTVIIPGELRGLCLSLLIMIGMLFGIGVAPVAVSLTSELLGGPLMIGKALTLVCVGTCIASATIFAYGGKHLGPMVLQEERA